MSCLYMKAGMLLICIVTSTTALLGKHTLLCRHTPYVMQRCTAQACTVFSVIAAVHLVSMLPSVTAAEMIHNHCNLGRLAQTFSNKCALSLS